jgi:hypothetical protein
MTIPIIIQPQETSMELESKAFGMDAPGGGLEVKKAFEDFLAGFEAFKQSNDERLNGLEKRSTDVLAEEKVDRINKALENQQRHIDALLLAEARPALSGGFKAQIAGLQKQIAERELQDAKMQAALAMARQAQTASGETQARAQALAQTATEKQIQTVIRKVPVYVDAQSDKGCVVPWGFVRLLDAAASGADPGFVAAHLAPGQPDDAASDVSLSETLALLAADLGAARQNADQLTHLENAVRP